MKIDRQDVLIKLLAMARGASEIVMNVYAGEDLGTELKGPDDPVTRADKETNAFLLREIETHLPGIPVVAEESDPSLFRGFESSKVALFVDPVDGTRDFIARTGEFCVMIGLAEDGRATVGVVLCPAFGNERVTYGGAEGVGAFFFGENGTRSPIHVASETNLAAVRCAVSRLSRNERLDAKLARLGVQELVPIGSAGIKGVEVASGHLALYAHPSRSQVKLWDACAPDAIIRAAGGILTDARGIPFDYQGAVAQGEGTVAANRTLHAEVVRRFASYDAGSTTP